MLNSTEHFPFMVALGNAFMAMPVGWQDHFNADSQGAISLVDSLESFENWIVRDKFLGCDKLTLVQLIIESYNQGKLNG